MKTTDTLYVDSNGQLVIGGVTAMELVRNFGTPLYVMDAQRIRSTANAITDTLKTHYPDSLVCYASKAFACKAMYQFIQTLGLGADVASGGELLTAMKSKMNPSTIYFHGSNKSVHELSMAVASDVHAVVVDSLFEIDTLNELALDQNKTQGVMVRVNPGVEAHTHHFVQTARPDSKFGFSISDGTALAVIGTILKKKGLMLRGIHCHIGSQIFDTKPFELAVDKMTDFAKQLHNTYQVEIDELNMGGGYGVTYTAEDKPLRPEEYVAAIAQMLNSCIREKGLKPPRLILEPGRGLVAESGTTLYSVGAIKEIAGIRKYISVDGGLFENPRYSLYEAKYEPILANRAKEPCTETVTIAGKCCESDLLIVDAKLPKANTGDILAVLSTGAYNYSMASNYNRNPVPPVVWVDGKRCDYIIKPQTYQDIMMRDLDLPKE